MANALREGLKKYFTPSQLDILHNARVGFAGAGGLGSNTAIILARCGIENMVLIDFDIVEKSNLNRQFYWPEHLGFLKTEALKEILIKLNPQIKIQQINIKLDKRNLPEILNLAPIWVEALDQAEIKALFVQEGIKKAGFITSASGVCGFGGEQLKKRQMGNLLIVGDYSSCATRLPPLAPRVIEAAAKMADGILDYLLKSRL